MTIMDMKSLIFSVLIFIIFFLGFN